MKKRLLWLIPAIGYVAVFGLMPCVYAQTSNTGEGIIPPPVGGTETIQLPQTENLEVVPITTQTTTISETSTTLQPIQPSENVLQPSATTPTIGEQPIAPVPEGAIPGIPLTATAGEVQTPSVTPSLQPLEQQVPMSSSAPAIAPVPAPVSSAPSGLQPLPAITQTPTTILQPSAELPVSPSTTTTEAISPTSTEITTPATQVTVPQVQAPQITVQTPVEEQPQPENLITKPPHIVPGEVLTGMPVYVNTRTTHVVKPGEDLHWLAAIYYGDARLWYKIYDANKSVIKNPNYLVVGTKLIIPPK